MLVSCAFAAELVALDIDRSGIATVVLSLEGEDASEMGIPQDASNFRIVGGSYEIRNGTAYITSGASGFTTFSFSSSSLTSKTSGGWRLFFSPPNGSELTVYMPPYAVIGSTTPSPLKVTAEDSRTSLEFPGEDIYVDYSLGEPPETAPQDTLPLFLAAGIIAVALIVAALLNRSRGSASPKPEKRPSLDITPGKKEMMETFNDNDRIIVDYLLSCEGKSKRNELERRTSISKSSLAKAINRLEKRKIIEIDRSATTHFVKLSDYFLKL